MKAPWLKEGVTTEIFGSGFMSCATNSKSPKQIAGNKKRSSEALLHLEIYKQRADVKSVVHCHPPHATAFAGEIFPCAVRVWDPDHVCPDR